MRFVWIREYPAIITIDNINRSAFEMDTTYFSDVTTDILNVIYMNAGFQGVNMFFSHWRREKLKETRCYVMGPALL